MVLWYRNCSNFKWGRFSTFYIGIEWLDRFWYAFHVLFKPIFRTVISYCCHLIFHIFLSFPCINNDNVKTSRYECSYRTLFVRMNVYHYHKLRNNAFSHQFKYGVMLFILQKFFAFDVICHHSFSIRNNKMCLHETIISLP